MSQSVCLTNGEDFAECYDKLTSQDSFACFDLEGNNEKGLVVMNVCDF